MIGWIILFAVLGVVAGWNAKPGNYLGLLVGGIIGIVSGYLVGRIMKGCRDDHDG